MFDQSQMNRFGNLWKATSKWCTVHIEPEKDKQTSINNKKEHLIKASTKACPVCLEWLNDFRVKAVSCKQWKTLCTFAN